VRYILRSAGDDSGKAENNCEDKQEDKMRRLIFLGMVLFLCLPLVAKAASIGGPETGGKGKVSVGLDQDYIFDREFKTVIDSDTQISFKSKIDGLDRTMAKVSYGILDNLDAYVKLGVAGGKSKTTYGGGSEGIDVSGSGKAKIGCGFAYGFGLKGTYNLPHDWFFVGADAQYLRHENDYKYTSRLTMTDPTIPLSDSEPFDWKGKFTVQEWHFAPYIAKTIKDFTPYFGVKYSDLRVKDSSNGSSVNYRAKGNFGVFTGTDYKLGDHWKFNLEGRFIDETALSVSCTYKF